MRRLLLAGLLGMGVLLLVPSPSFACSCAAGNIAEHARTAESVGSGTVAWSADDGQTRVYSVSFDEVYKGELAMVEKVLTNVAESACGLSVVTGRRYLFFLDGTHRGVIRANSCGGTTPYTAQVAAEIARATGSPTKPLAERLIKSERSPPGRPWWWGYAAGLVAIGIVGGAVHLGRRRLRHTPGELDARSRPEKNSAD